MDSLMSHRHGQHPLSRRVDRRRRISVMGLTDHACMMLPVPEDIEIPTGPLTMEAHPDDIVALEFQAQLLAITGAEVPSENIAIVHAGATTNMPLHHTEPRKRKRLPLSQTLSMQEYSAHAEETDVDEHATSHAEQAREILTDSEIRALTKSALLNDLRELLAQEQPLQWLFIGDDVVGGDRKVGQAPAFVDLFSERVRWELRRFPDMFVNAGATDFQIDTMKQDLEDTILKVKPDVVILMPGRRESVLGLTHLPVFRQQLRLVCQRIAKQGITLVLQTPPPFHIDQQTISDESSSQYANLERYIDAIREVAIENEYPLIDHNDDWQQQNLMMDHLIDPATQKITGDGHRMLCSLLLHELDLYDRNSKICEYCYFPQRDDLA